MRYSLRVTINVFVNCRFRFIFIKRNCELLHFDLRTLLHTVRLAGGWSSREGRLEVNYNGVWGTVRDDGFNDKAAKVACYSMGFGYVC